jgi:DNA polymerase III subunit epsilon
VSPIPRGQIPRFAAFGMIIVMVIAVLSAIWFQLTNEENAVLQGILREHPALIVSAMFLFPLAVVIAVNWVFRHYIEPVRKLSEEVTLMNLVNPSHRLTVGGSREVQGLSTAINLALDQIQSLQKNVAAIVSASQTEVERERTTLAVMIDEFPRGVVVCNIDGCIVLYNRRARSLLTWEGESATNTTDRGYLGLGRSIFSAISKNLITHALEVIAGRLASPGTSPTARFITAGNSRGLLRVDAAPILDNERRLQGFLLMFDDIAREFEQEHQRAALLQSLVERVRSSLATTRTAIEVLLDHPELESFQRDRLTNIIHAEALALSAYIECNAADYSKNAATHLVADDMLCSDLLLALKRQCEQSIDVQVSVTHPDEQLWIRIDSYMMVQGLVSLVDQLKQSTGTLEYQCRAIGKDGMASIDLLWKGSPVPSATIRGWEESRLRIDGQETTVTIAGVFRRHDAEIWSGRADDRIHAYLRVLLPCVDRSRTVVIQPSRAIPSRPEFYDFNLFSVASPSELHADRGLDELIYTAFDTETTGLRPSEGDEIISLGGIRIVNGRLLREEHFDFLVDPQRPLSLESIGVHGITEEMLRGRPTIDHVLPEFLRFAEGTVLVGHNAAFDMRFFEVIEGRSGIRVASAVLDTLLLSHVVHPHQEDHTLEGIAGRLGVSLIGRHTALGDALVTGEVFLRLLPLLQHAGIHTLRQALEASQKTYLARVKY